MRYVSTVDIYISVGANDDVPVSLVQQEAISKVLRCLLWNCLDELTHGQIVRRPQFSWTRIKGESDVKGGGGHGWVEASAGSGVGADGGSPEGERSRRRRRGALLHE